MGESMIQSIMENQTDYIRIDKFEQSKDVLIIFSHIDYPCGKFAMTNALKDLSITKIYVNCHDNSWYQEGLKGITKNINETADILSEIINSLNPAKVTCIGQSMGGYAALVFGLKLKCNDIISFAPEIQIGNKHTRSYYLNKIKKYDSKYKNLTHLINNNDRTKIWAIFGVYDIIDLSLLWSIENVLLNKKTFKTFFCLADHRVTLSLDLVDIIKMFLKKGKLQKNDISKEICRYEDITKKELFLYREIRNFLDNDDSQSIYEILKNEPEIRIYSQFGLFFCNACMALEKYDEAENILNHIIKVDPNNVQTCHLLGVITHRKKNWNKAKEWYSKALEIQPNVMPSLYRLGTVELNLKNYSHAEKLFKTTLEIDEKNAEVHFHLGYLLMEKDRYDEAECYFKNALKYNPNSKRFRDQLEILEKLKG